MTLIKIGEIHFKCDAIDGTVSNGARKPKLFSFVLDNLVGCKIFCQLETKQKKLNKPF